MKKKEKKEYVYVYEGSKGYFQIVISKYADIDNIIKSQPEIFNQLVRFSVYKLGEL